jgi:hypothetical protein
MDKDKLSWLTRLKLCCAVLTKGKYNHEDFKTVYEQEQWEICELKRKELAAACRPRTKVKGNPFDIGQ